MLNNCPLSFSKSKSSYADKFFPEESFIQINIRSENEINRIINLIKNDNYESRLSALAKARELILNKYNMWPMIHQAINKGEIAI